MSASTYKQLLGGSYICPVRFPSEFHELQSPVEFDRADALLRQLDMYLTRVGDSGAFFAAPLNVGADDIRSVKANLLEFRDTYGPYVLALEQIRQSVGDVKSMTPGEYISVYELETAVNQSSVLESGLNAMVNLIPNASARMSHHENLKRMLEHLVKGEYAVLANKDTNTYQLTGKLDQLYVVLQYLKDHGDIPDEQVLEDEDDDTPDLFTA